MRMPGVTKSMATSRVSVRSDELTSRRGFARRWTSPYFAIGSGWADYEQSTTTLEGRPNAAPRTVNHGVFDYGGGVDFKFWRFVGLRAEIRDFYTGSPSYNAPALSGGQHNVV